MDGLEQQLSQILSNPESMKQLQGMMSSLGLGGQNEGDAQPPRPSPQPLRRRTCPRWPVCWEPLGMPPRSNSPSPRPL